MIENWVHQGTEELILHSVTTTKTEQAPAEIHVKHMRYLSYDTASHTAAMG